MQKQSQKAKQKTSQMVRFRLKPHKEKLAQLWKDILKVSQRPLGQKSLLQTIQRIYKNKKVQMQTVQTIFNKADRITA